MFENDNQSPSDASSEVSSEPQQTVNEAVQQELRSEAAPKQQPDIASQLDERLDKHPRFRELIEQKNSYAKTVEEMNQKYRDLEQRLIQNPPQTQKQEDALIARLKGIDPEFAERIEQMNSKASRVESLEQRLQAFEAAQSRSAVETQVRSLFTEHKVPEYMQEAYELKLRDMGARNPNLKLGDLPKVFKDIHDGYSKMIDSIRKSERESYLVDKKKDAKVPTSQPKGQTPPTGNKAPYSSDPNKARAERVADVLKMVRAEKES